MVNAKALSRSLALLALCASLPFMARADSTFSGTFSADNQVFEYDFSNVAAQNYLFDTTSYAGGLNVNGTASAGGGFAPVLSLYNGTTDQFLMGGGTGGVCNGSTAADTITGLCDDAYFSTTLGPGDYVLQLTEFPNYPVGNLGSGFQFGGDPNATGTVCGVSGGQFLESDVAPCVQRNGNYTVNVGVSPVPEPSTWLLMVAPLLALPVVQRRRIA